jgi:hypothetical protein
MSSEFENFQQAILAIVAQQNQKIADLEARNENQQHQIATLQEQREELQNLHYGTSERFLLLEQNKRHAEAEIEKLKEELKKQDNQQLQNDMANLSKDNQKLREEIEELRRLFHGHYHFPSVFHDHTGQCTTGAYVGGQSIAK